MPKDLRSFLSDLMTARPGEIRRVSDPVDPRFGATAVAARFARDNQYPALYFEKVGCSAIPLVLNLTATYERLALALGTTLADLVPTFGERMAHPVPAREVSRGDAPVKEQVWTGDDVDLGKLPLLTHNELDAGAYVTSGIGIMRDPETGRINAGIYRHQVHSRNELGVWFIDTHHGAYIYRRYEERGQAAPIVIAIGHHPAVVMGAVCRIPGVGGEFDAAGGLLGESVEITRAETCDLPVPARAEIVIEGEVIPHERKQEGPFGEWPGHYTEQGPKPVIRVNAITMRQKPIYYDIFSANREHLVLGGLPRMGSIYRNRREGRQRTGAQPHALLRFDQEGSRCRSEKSGVRRPQYRAGKPENGRRRRRGHRRVQRWRRDVGDWHPVRCRARSAGHSPMVRPRRVAAGGVGLSRRRIENTSHDHGVDCRRHETGSAGRVSASRDCAADCRRGREGRPRYGVAATSGLGTTSLTTSHRDTEARSKLEISHAIGSCVNMQLSS